MAFPVEGSLALVPVGDLAVTALVFWPNEGCVFNNCLSDAY